MDFGALLILYFIVISLQPLIQQRVLEVMRHRKVSTIDQARKSRV